MKTPHLDNLINDLKSYDRNDMLSDDGRNQLNEYEAIKRALSLGDVVGQSEQLKCHHQYVNAGTLQGDAMKKCLKCGDYVKAL